MKAILIILVIFLPSLSQAYIWDAIGPENVESNFYCCLFEIICTSSGILRYEEDNWVEYSYGGLPVWEAYPLVPGYNDLLVVMGDGSDSDGVYLFSFEIEDFINLYWLMNPRFLSYFPQNGCYFAGGEEGLIISEDGFTWESITFFDGKFCYSVAVKDDHIVVAADDNVYYSHNCGEDWAESSSYLNLTDLVYSVDGTLYGIFPGTSYSSGLWSSADNGVNWEVEFWDVMLKSVGLDAFGNIFVGWEEPANSEGIAIWNPATEELSFFNDGLSNLYNNNLLVNELINCNNIVSCTDGGVYQLTGYSTGIDDQKLELRNPVLSNHPNPFTGGTMISLTVDGRYEPFELEIFNIRGEKIRRIESDFLRMNQGYAFFWDGRDEHNNRVSPGIYLYQLNFNDRKGAVGKCVLIK